MSLVWTEGTGWSEAKADVECRISFPCRLARPPKKPAESWRCWKPFQARAVREV